jgi:hypothetical protein
MKYRTRIQYTETDKALMWERWRRGESLKATALSKRTGRTQQDLLREAVDALLMRRQLLRLPHRQK